MSTITIPFPTVANPVARPSFLSSIPVTRPVPTNKWWVNFYLGGGVNPVTSLPYKYIWGAKSLIMSRPIKIINTTNIVTSTNNDIILTWTNPGAQQIINWDDIGCILNWGANIVAHVVQGSPYLVLNLTNQTFTISTIHAITNINKVNANQNLISFNDGSEWLINGSVALTYTQSGNTLTFTNYSGLLTIANVPVSNDPTWTSLLTGHANNPVTGGTFTTAIANNKVTATIKFTTVASSNALYLLPTHASKNANEVAIDVIGYDSIIGPLLPYVNTSVSYTVPAATVDFFPSTTIDPKHLQDVISAVSADQPILNTTADSYFPAKELARVARLILIADDVGLPNIVKSNLAWLEKNLGDFLNSKYFTWAYDTVYKGLTIKEFLANPSMDFGYAFYNDRHFHHSFYLYCLAVIAKYDPTWYQTYQNIANVLIADVMNSVETNQFPKQRMFEAWSGHSWASGIAAIFADDRNQESTSEAVNFYYATSLLAQVTNNQTLLQEAQALLTLEILSSQVYWHMPSSSTIYPTPFNSNKIFANLFSDKCDCNTWFSSNISCIHGIEITPITPITAQLLDMPWCQEQYEQYLSVVKNQNVTVTDPWKGIMIASEAIFDPAQAWIDAQTLTSYDDGNSKSNLLSFIAYQSGPARAPIPPPLPPSVVTISITIPADLKGRVNVVTTQE